MNTIDRIRTEANEHTAICRAGRQDLTAMPDFVRRRIPAGDAAAEHEKNIETVRQQYGN